MTTVLLFLDFHCFIKNYFFCNFVRVLINEYFKLAPCWIISNEHFQHEIKVGGQSVLRACSTLIIFVYFSLLVFTAPLGCYSGMFFFSLNCHLFFLGLRFQPAGNHIHLFRLMSDEVNANCSGTKPGLCFPCMEMWLASPFLSFKCCSLHLHLNARTVELGLAAVSHPPPPQWNWLCT